MKTELRKKFKKLRADIMDKAVKDKKICASFLKSDIYARAEQIFCYAALHDEINTNLIIDCALKDNKKVALPFCTDLNGNMEYYYIHSAEDLKTGSFGISEPDTEKCEKALNFEKAVCIVPALSFDAYGFRLGYGKGYYDRFLKKFTSVSVGLCYNELMSSRLPVNEFDESVSYIASEDGIVPSILNIE